MPARNTTLPPELAIRAEGLGKRFGPPAASRWRRIAMPAGPERDAELELDEDDEELEPLEPSEPAVERVTGETWALRDVSFSVSRGAGLALVGPSGSGKSTVLRILARVSRPTEGRVLVRGRVSPIVDGSSNLLQSGLSVRRNIVLLAQLLGVPKATATRNTPAIAEFAELESELDLRLDRLSSRMRRRLAVSITLGLEPDVVLLEEAAITADDQFGAKVVERLRSEREQGLTIVLATTDRALAEPLCEQYALLDAGRLVETGTLVEPEPPAAEEDEAVPDQTPRRQDRKPENEHAAILGAAPAGGGGSAVEALPVGDDLRVRVELDVKAPGAALRFGLALASSRENLVRVYQRAPFVCERAGRYDVTVTIPGGYLQEARYVARVGAFVGPDSESAIALEDAFALDVVGAGTGNDAREVAPPGIVTLEDAVWSIERAEG